MLALMARWRQIKVSSVYHVDLSFLTQLLIFLGAYSFCAYFPTTVLLKGDKSQASAECKWIIFELSSVSEFDNVDSIAPNFAKLHV